MIYYATRHDITGARSTSCASNRLALGLAAAVVVSLLDYEVYRRYQWALYAVAVVLVAAVLPLGLNVKGATRWFNLGFMRLQPSALAMLFMLLASVPTLPTVWIFSAPGV